MSEEKPLGFPAAWAMAVGGMIGGGMFATLGLMLDIAGPAAWASFLLAGAAAYATANSYAVLTGSVGQGGGIFRFLMASGRPRAGLFVAVALIAAYTLSMAVYAYTFGAYVAEAFPNIEWLLRALAIASLLGVLAVNLVGAAQASLVEIIAVAVKLIALAGLAAFGLARFSSEPFVPDAFDLDLMHAIVLGAATVFMAFQGFQLLTYDYDDIRRPQRTLQRAFRWAIITTTVIYVLITIAAVLIVGVEEIVANRETALNAMGRSALGAAGLYAMIAVAALATVTAINATLFATARLARTASLEAGLWSERERGPPPLRPFLIALSLLAVFLAALGGVQDLIRWASFLFLLVFAGVNFMALRQRADRRTVSLFGLLATLSFVCVLVAYRLA